MREILFALIIVACGALIAIFTREKDYTHTHYVIEGLQLKSEYKFFLNLHKNQLLNKMDYIMAGGRSFNSKEIQQIDSIFTEFLERSIK